MPQLSYSLNTPFATQPGSAASSMPEECYTGLGLVSGAQTVTATVANSTAYQLTFVTSAGNRTATYTSDGSATKAEIVAGLQAAVNALGDADYAAFNVGGDLVLQPKAGVSSPRAVSSTGAGTLAIASRSGILPFGVAVALDVTRFDSNDPQTLPVRLPNASTDKILGIVRFTQFFESYGASVAKKGHFWVSPEVAVTAGDPVYARHTANGGLTQLGALRNDADTSNAIQLAGCRFLSSALAGGFAVVELNLP
jgi:hypothetical protein